MTPWTLLGPGGEYRSDIPGTLGGHRRTRIFGRLDCGSALRAIGRGGYVRHRVFFADEATAVRTGFRPCAVCMPEAYAAWKGVERVATSEGQTCGSDCGAALRRPEK